MLPVSRRKAHKSKTKQKTHHHPLSPNSRVMQKQEFQYHHYHDNWLYVVKQVITLRDPISTSLPHFLTVPPCSVCTHLWSSSSPSTQPLDGAQRNFVIQNVSLTFTKWCFALLKTILVLLGFVCTTSCSDDYFFQK